MYESIKEQRKKFIASLKSDVSKYRTNILSNEESKKIDAEQIRKDWGQVGADIKSSIPTGIYEDLVKGLNSTLKNVIENEYENEK